MVENNIFQYAAKHKLRFPYKGACATEDLYKLSLEELDGIYGKLKVEEKDSQQVESLLTPVKVDKDLEVKIAIIKNIVEEKKAEKEKAEKAAVRKAERQRLLDALAGKEAEELSKATKDEILDKLAALDAEE